MDIDIVGLDEEEAQLARDLINQGFVSGLDDDDDDEDDDDIGFDDDDDDEDDDDEDDVGFDDDDDNDDDDGLMNAIGEVDIVGDIEIVDDDEDEVGRRRRRRSRGRRRISRKRFRRLLKRAVRRRARRTVRRRSKRSRGGSKNMRRPRLQQRPLHNGKEMLTRYLAITRDVSQGGLVPAGQETDITVEPQMPFRGVALIVDEDIARDFLISDMKYGTMSVFANSGRIPATAFLPNSEAMDDLVMPTNQTSQQFTLRVVNKSNEPRPFYATVKGWGAQ